MAMEQYIEDAMARNDPNREDGASLEKLKSVSAALDRSKINPTGGFDCNICLDIVLDPVVTLCGHLYCWPCIYKWIHYHNVSAENPDHKQPQCPVCKAEVSNETLVPLYGRGQITKPSEGKAPNLGIVIPQRPPSPRCGVHTLIPTATSDNLHPAQQLRRRSYPRQPQPYYPDTGRYAASPILTLGGTTATSGFNPMIGCFGEMVYARIFGNSETTLYTSGNSYHLAGSSSPRLRRHIMQADESLSRICFFLFCCIIFCLLLF